MDKAIIQHYLHEWGWLKRTGWKPSDIGYKKKSVVPGGDYMHSVDEETMLQVFAAMNAIQKYEYPIYQVLDLTYAMRKRESDVALLVGLSGRRVRELIRQGEDKLRWYLVGAAA